MLIQAAWAAVRVRGRLQARYSRLVRRFGGERNPGAKKRAITAIAHTLLKIAYQVLKTGKPYPDLGADFYTRRESPGQQQAYLERRLQKLNPGCTVTITISPAGGRLSTRRLTTPPDPSPATGAAADPAPRPTRRTNQRHRHSPRHRTGQGPLPRAHRDPDFVSGEAIRAVSPPWLGDADL